MEGQKSYSLSINPIDVLQLLILTLFIDITYFHDHWLNFCIYNQDFTETLRHLKPEVVFTTQ